MSTWPRCNLIHVDANDRGIPQFISMAIMFKKTAVILFLLSHHVFVAASGTEQPNLTGKRTVNGMSLRDKAALRPSSKTVEQVELIGPKKRRRVVKRKNLASTPNHPSPLGITNLLANSSGSTTIATVDSSSPSTASVLMTNESEVDIANWDSFNFNFGGDDDINDNAADLKDGDDFLHSNEAFLTGEMIQAIKKGNLAAVRESHRQVPEVFVNINNPAFELGGISPFMYAIRSGNRAMVDFLVSTGKVDPNAVSDVGDNVMQMIIEQFADVELVKNILRNSTIKITHLSAFKLLCYLRDNLHPMFAPVIEVMTSLKQKPMIAALIVLAKDAVTSGRIKLVKFLGQKGVPLNLPYKNNMSFIHFAANRGDIKMTDLLLKNGADIDALAYDAGLSPLQIALYNGKFALVLHLMKKGARIGLDEVLEDSIDNERFDILDEFLELPGDLSYFTLSDHYNLITYSIAKDRPTFLKHCLTKCPQKFNLFVCDEAGRTIYNMPLPKYASDDLRQIVDGLRNSLLTPDDFDDIFECLNDEEN